MGFFLQLFSDLNEQFVYASVPKHLCDLGFSNALEKNPKMSLKNCIVFLF